MCALFGRTVCAPAKKTACVMAPDRDMETAFATGQGKDRAEDIVEEVTMAEAGTAVAGADFIKVRRNFAGNFIFALTSGIFWV